MNAQDRTRVEMEACAVTECKGPALDLSQHAQAYVRDSLFRDCSGVPRAMQHCAITDHNVPALDLIPHAEAC